MPLHATSTRAADFRRGARAMLPVVVAYVPFGLVVGGAVAASAEPWIAWGATFAIYGGAAQLAVLESVADGSGWVASALVGLLIQARLFAYAADLAPGWREASLWHRLAAAAMLTDAPWAAGRRRSRSFYVGSAGVIAVAWPILVAVGAVVGRVEVPAAEILLPLTLGVVVAPQLGARPPLATAAAAAVAALMTLHLGTGEALLIASGAGAIAGWAARRRG